MNNIPVDLGQFLKNVEIESEAALQFLHENRSKLPYALDMLRSLQGQEEKISDTVKHITDRDCQYSPVNVPGIFSHNAPGNLQPRCTTWAGMCKKTGEIVKVGLW